MFPTDEPDSDFIDWVEVHLDEVKDAPPAADLDEPEDLYDPEGPLPQEPLAQP